MTEPDKPGRIAQLRAKYAWFDHLAKAGSRYESANGDFYAAAITYFTILSLFPLLMVGFAVVGFVLASQPHLLDQIDTRITSTVSGDFGHQIVDLMDSAIKSRTSIGLIGLGAALWAGLGWVAKLRQALSQIWDQRTAPDSFIRSKVSDLGALISTFVAILLTIGLTVLADPYTMAKVLAWFQISHIPGLGGLLRAVSLVMSWAISWLLYTWMIARLPLEPLTVRKTWRAGLLAAVGFEVFKLVGSIYLQSVLHGPAGATFGPVLGLMVFAYITARLVLFATAWAATTVGNERPESIPPPGPALISVRAGMDEGLSSRQAAAAMVVGAIGGLGLSRLWRVRRK
jgi:membrane protein